MKPSRGFELKASSSSRGGAGISILLNSYDLNQIMFKAGFSFKFGPLMKMLVPPANEAYLMPSAASD